MIVIIFILFAFLFIFSVFFRTIVTNPTKSIFYSISDFIKFLYYRKFNNMETGKLICYTALFGGGKTLSCVHYVRSLYFRYNNKKVYDINRKKWVTQKVHIISNVDLLDIPYERFTSLAQIVKVADTFKALDEDCDTLTCTIVLGDEFSVQMNSRNFKSNIDPLFLNTLLTCRHHHIMLIYNAQRFNHVDALLRQVTTYCVECKKVWRVLIQNTYDAYVLENTSDPTTVKPLSRSGWFIKDSDYNAFDTLAVVGNLKKSIEEGDMLSESEIINNLGNNDNIDIGSFKKWKKIFKRH